jgi:UDP-3-O-[3-hydroxymyristoyl] glucosamine N-acyltransferase
VQFTVHELAALVGGQFSLEAANEVRPITGAAAIAEAGEGDVTFFGNARYLPALKTSRATAALVPLDFAETIPPFAIRVANPSLAFAKLLERFAPPPIRFASGIHPTAVIGKDAQIAPEASVQAYAVIEAGVVIGAGTVIGAQCYVGHDARIGTDCQIASRVVVAARCVIGDRVILHSGVVIGSDGFGFEFADGRHVKIPQTGIVQVDNDVEIGANTTVDRARFGRTWIGEGTKIDNLVQIGHNVAIGRHCIICGQAGISGSVKVGDYVTLGGQVGVVGHIEIGARALVGAQSGVTKNLPPGETYWGTPATPMREAKELVAHFHRLPRLHAMVRRMQQILDSKEKSLPPDG